jgi:peptidyl-prolyl cis-trans isomerase D
MLRDIKQKSSGLGAKIIMGLLIIAFVFWGVSGSILSAGSDGAATVNGEKITINKFNLAHQTAKNRLTKQFGDNVGSEYFDSVNFKRGVLNQLIDAELLKQEAAKFDYDVAPAKIKSYIESSAGLQIDGKFSKEAYANYLSQVNKSADLLQRDIKEELQSAALPQLISQSSFALKSEIEDQYKLSKQKRTFNYIEISSNDFKDKVKVTEDEIKEHYKEFSQDYMTQEQVSVNYIELSTADLLKNIEVTDEEVKTFYDAKKENLKTAEKRKAQHILLTVDGNEAEVKVAIQKIEKRIKDGEDFAAIAKEISQDPGSAKNGGDLGWVAKGDMVEAFDKKLFTMKVGEISEPVLSSFGYHIIKLSEIKSPEVPALEEIKDSLVQELKLEKAEEEFLSTADDLSTIIIDADNVLEVAAENSGLAMQNTDLFAMGRGTGIAANPNFSKAAFSDAIKVDNEISEMVDLGENHIAYIQIKEHKVPEVKPLEEVSEAIKLKLESEKARDMAREQTKALLTEITTGKKTLIDVATELGKTVQEAQDVERVGSKLPFNLVKNVFTLKFDANKVMTKFIEASVNSFALIELLSVVDGDLKTMTEDEKLNLDSQIKRTASNTEILNITAELRKNANININEKVFEDAQQ